MKERLIADHPGNNFALLTGEFEIHLFCKQVGNYYVFLITWGVSKSIKKETSL